MTKTKISNNTSIFPMPVTVVGTIGEGRANFMAVGWVTRINMNPPMVAIGLNNGHFTTKSIRESKAFSICFPSKNLIEKADYCGIVSGKRVDKSKLFEVFTGDTGAPMAAECPLCLDCRLVQETQFPTNTMFIGEIVGAYADEACLSNGKPDIKKIDPLLLTMPDNLYWTVGEKAGDAWKAGKGLKA